MSIESLPAGGRGPAGLPPVRTGTKNLVPEEEEEEEEEERGKR